VFVCLKDEGNPAEIGCTTILLKWGRSSEYLVSPLTSSNSGWHSEWSYLQNNPECPLPAYTRGYYDMAPQVWSNGPVKKDQQKLLSSCREALAAL
jgi:hypothetical protein